MGMIKALRLIYLKTTLGIPILVILLRLFTYAIAQTPLGNPPESIQSGNYGQPPKSSWWAKQSLIYFFGLLGMKTCVLFVFHILPWISRVGDWALRWTEGNETVQVAFVMLLFPLIMNALQYYIIDSFIKNSKISTEETASGLDGEDEDDQDGVEERDSRRRDQYNGVSNSDEGEEVLAKSLQGGTARVASPSAEPGHHVQTADGGRRKDSLEAAGQR